MKEFSEVSTQEIQEHYKAISQNIKKIRLEKQLTQEDVALSMGFTTATFYTNAENNKNNKHFNLEHLIKIAKIMQVSIQDLFDYKLNSKTK